MCLSSFIWCSAMKPVPTNAMRKGLAEAEVPVVTKGSRVRGRAAAAVAVPRRRPPLYGGILRHPVRRAIGKRRRRPHRGYHDPAPAGAAVYSDGVPGLHPVFWPPPPPPPGDGGA